MSKSIKNKCWTFYSPSPTLPVPQPSPDRGTVACGLGVTLTMGLPMTKAVEGREERVHWKQTERVLVSQQKMFII